MNGMPKSISCPNIAAPGEALSTVQWVEPMAYAASDGKTSMLLGFTELALSMPHFVDCCLPPSFYCHLPPP
jgi:hypothetical protein